VRYGGKSVKRGAGKKLEDDNRRLKHMLADPILDRRTEDGDPK